ncbi:deoxynucleoside triphosphate triphosphohydrolase SAMHD1-like [Octopus bimaculoides]|uniref:deoxynucleoside triphosphate triphosphohydrolase SAMHD1-like n=1 Tax=Octopus bimaculoides TaxID=37653 RepID=UPI00078A2002|nr:deoxynucleoside triphosphate triphosphohydrolase SAMHD1-like [Octopus bimaculoides]
MANSRSTYWDQVFQDAIHGAMQLPPLCVDIINTIQFQRLRNIKQLGLVYYVYPCASHNRFEHCLGTCYLASKMIRHLKEQNPDLQISDRDILCVEIAALCHNLGHGPFSYAFQEIINQHRKENGGEKWKNENATCEMLDELLKKNGHIKKELELDDIDFIKDIIIGEPRNSKKKKPKFFYQIVNNTDYKIDVNKWDYLARDSHFLGIGKSFDHGRMMKMSKVINDEICYRDKTLDNFYDMFYSRYRLHKAAYQHKTVLLFNTLLGEAFRSADKHMKIFEKVDDMKKFTYFTDSVLEEILKNENNEGLKEAQKILESMFYRHYKYNGTDKDGNYQGEDQEKIFCEANLDYGAGEENPLEKIPFYKKGGIESFKYKQQELEDKLLLPKKFHLKIYHCFEKRVNN